MIIIFLFSFQLYNYFEDSNYVYLVLEICHNGELNRYLKANCRVVSETEARHFMLQIVSGMLYLHSHGILHRDLTLANLLLTKSMDLVSVFSVDNVIVDFQLRLAQWVRSLDLTTHTSLSPIRRGFAPGFVNYKKGCTRLAAACDKVYQLLAHGRWFSPGIPASSTTNTGCHDIAEILLKVALKHQKSNQIKLLQTGKLVQ
jgi:serine/threonine protein kinase